MAVSTLEKSRFRSVQLDITDVIVKTKLERINLYIYTHTYIYIYIYIIRNKRGISREAVIYTFDCRWSREVYCAPSL